MAGDKDDGGDRGGAGSGPLAKRMKFDPDAPDASAVGRRSGDDAGYLLSANAGGREAIPEEVDAVSSRGGGNAGGNDDGGDADDCQESRKGQTALHDTRDDGDDDGGGGEVDGNAGDVDHSLEGYDLSGRGGRGAAALPPPTVGQKRRRGRPPKSASAAGNSAGGRGNCPAGRWSARGVPGTAPGVAGSRVGGSGFGDDGMERCPLCGSSYKVAQLEAHVEMCMVRRETGSAGAGSKGGAWLGVPGSGSSSGAGPAMLPAPVALPQAPAATGGAVAAAPALQAAPVPVPDFQIPPARSFHPMKVAQVK